MLFNLPTRLHLPLILLLLFLGACSSDDPTDPTPATQSAAEEPTDPTSTSKTDDPSSPTDLWWQRIQALCGKAFSGSLVSEDAVDADFRDRSMVMHVRRCDPERIEIPFHIDENRSRTWVLTRKGENEIHLQHDHRHEDGSEDAVTLYGGISTAGSAREQSFPADDYSRRIFAENDLAASVDNTWVMEIVPDERFSYVMRRPGRYFQANFDLREEVDPPPAPWGHD